MQEAGYRDTTVAEYALPLGGLHTKLAVLGYRYSPELTVLSSATVAPGPIPLRLDLRIKSSNPIT